MWANTLPGRCASLNMSKNNPPACPIAKPRGLAALLQWDKYFTTQYRETPGLWGMPGWHTPRLSLPFLHSLLCAEDLAHTFLPRPNLLDTEVKGLHKTRQMQFGKGRTWKGSVRDIAGFCCSKDGAEMGQTSQSTAEDRGMSSNLPLPQQLIFQQREQLCLGKSFFAFHQLYGCAGSKLMKGCGCSHKGAEQPQPPKHFPQPWIISAAPQPTEEILPFAPSRQPGCSLIYKLWGSGWRLIMHS